MYSLTQEVVVLRKDEPQGMVMARSVGMPIHGIPPFYEVICKDGHIERFLSADEIRPSDGIKFPGFFPAATYI